MKHFRQKGFAYNVAKIKHAFLYEPSITDLKKKMEWCIHNELDEVSIENRKWAEETFLQEKLITTWKEEMSKCFILGQCEADCSS